MSDKPEPTAEEKMADALPANAKYVAAQQNIRRGLPVTLHIRIRRIRLLGSYFTVRRAASGSPSGCLDSVEAEWSPD